MEKLQEAFAIEDLGLQGCSHARGAGPRQILLVDFETLESLELSPGMIRENITTRGLNVNGLKPGQCLRVGEAHLEVTMPCTPCGQIEALRPGLRKEIRGRRGTFCRVRKGGKICQGDAIEKMP